MAGDAAARLAAAEIRIADLTRENERLRSSIRPETDGSDPATLSVAVYETLLANVADYALIATDLAGRILVWNQASADVFGWPTERMLGRPVSEIFTPDDRAAGLVLAEMATAAREGRATDNRWLLRADGTTFFARGELVPLRDAEGRHIGYLKILRDRTDEEISRLELAASRERLQFALDASALVGTWDWLLPQDIVYADARFAHLYGVNEALAAAGLPIETYLHGIHPDDRARVGLAIEEAIASGGDFSQEYRTVRRDGEVRWVHARGRCFLNDAGRPARFPGAVVDITHDKLRGRRQDALLRLGDLGGLGESIDYTLKALHLLGETLEIGRVGYAMVDSTETYASIVGEWTTPGLAPLSGRLRISDFGGGLIEALREGMTVVSDVRTDPITQDGAAAWEAIGSLSMINLSVREAGRLQVILYLHHTAPRRWTEDEIGFIREVLNRAWTYSRRRQAERSLIETEARLRLAHEAAEMGTFDYDLNTGEMVCDARCRCIFGIGEGPVTYAGSFRPRIDPDDLERVESAVKQAMNPDSDGSFDLVLRTVGHDDGRTRIVHASGQCVSADGVPVRIVCAVRDVTEAKEAEERQALLTRELQHRVKNTLAMVNALANQTLRRAATAQEGLAAFSARLMALSHAHDILTQTSWASAPIEAIVSQALATHGGEDERIAWEGPELRLTARQSLALALALHELATNAAKYGALSNETGRVAISWNVTRGVGCESLRFEWRETGGPPVVAPERKGFGSRLIEQSLAAEFGGEVVVTYDPAGLVCIIRADLQLDPEDSVLPSALGEP